MDSHLITKMVLMVIQMCSKIHSKVKMAFLFFRSEFYFYDNGNGNVLFNDALNTFIYGYIGRLTIMEFYLIIMYLYQRLSP